MTHTTLTVVRPGLPFPAAAPGEQVVSDEEVRRWVRSGEIVRHVQRYRSARLLTDRLATAGRPMILWPLRLLARQCHIRDTDQKERPVPLSLLLRWTIQLVGEAGRRNQLLRSVQREVAALRAAADAPHSPAYKRDAPVLYLRTDLSFSVRAGGSVGHIAGVLNALAEDGPAPIFVTTAVVPTVGSHVEVHAIPAPEAFWNFRELPTLVMNGAVYRGALQALASRSVSLVYQRYSLNNYAGLQLACRLNVPFVLEYNGSEIWMARHWGQPLTYEALAGEIELLNLRAADLIVVVSRAMRDELSGRGVANDRILVNPNAVDAERYSPAVTGRGIAERYGLTGCRVLGFIGTFGPWHGADVLADAFVQLLRTRPDYAATVRLLMIGDGAGRGRCEEILAAAGLDRLAVFTGLVPQDEGPAYLAACDILVSPHVPNPDGSPFFGSPTKLFEYMAMGKAIIASNLDQIGEILRHDVTGWLVPPGDRHALAAGLLRLLDDDALRGSLGDAARRDAVAHHTWRAHVDTTRAALDARVRAAV